jgi:hypothetical protein
MEDEVRYRTQHVGDTVRLSQARLRVCINTAYRDTRTKLQDWAPRWGLNKTAELTVATGAAIDMAVSATNFERIHLVETKRFVADGYSATYDRWLTVAAAGGDPTAHGHAPIWFEDRNKEIILQPEGFVSGLFRVFYHYTPADLAADAGIFDVPEAIIPYMKSMAAREVYSGDRNYREAKTQEDRAADELEEALPLLAKRYGMHDDHSGLVQVQGY